MACAGTLARASRLVPFAALVLAACAAPIDGGDSDGEGAADDPGAGGATEPPAAGGAPGTSNTGGAAGASTGGGDGGDPGGAAGEPGGGGSAPQPGDGGSGGGAPNAAFVEGFESYPERALAHLGKLGELWTADIRNGATMAVDATRPYSGARSLHITTPSGGDRQAVLLFGRPILPSEGNTLYGRAMIFLKQNPRDGVHWNYFGAGGLYQDPGTGRFQSLGWDWGGHNSSLQAFYSVNDCWTRAEARVMPEGKWDCFQWKYQGSADGKRELFVWMYGQPAPSLFMRGAPQACSGGAAVPWLAPTFTSGYIGWMHAQASAIPIEVWFDDVVLGPEPIACPAGYRP